MQLKVLLPSKVFALSDGVTRIVATTRSGSYGLLPQRLDCVAALLPGILSYSNAAGNEIYLATDEGILLKTGAYVLVCVRDAIGGTDLANLRACVDQHFLKIDERRKSVRSTLARLESGFMRRILELQHE